MWLFIHYSTEKSVLVYRLKWFRRGGPSRCWPDTCSAGAKIFCAAGWTGPWTRPLATRAAPATSPPPSVPASTSRGCLPTSRRPSTPATVAPRCRDSYPDSALTRHALLFVLIVVLPFFPRHSETVLTVHLKLFVLLSSYVFVLNTQ